MVDINDKVDSIEQKHNDLNVYVTKMSGDLLAIQMNQQGHEKEIDILRKRTHKSDNTLNHQGFRLERIEEHHIELAKAVETKLSGISEALDPVQNKIEEFTKMRWIATGMAMVIAIGFTAFAWLSKNVFEILEYLATLSELLESSGVVQ